jgi:tRNA pseudouridine55 synthase
LPNGFINVYKPRNMTSHDVVAVIRRCLPKKTRVGHTGTLDPDATGILPVCVGKGTRLAEYFAPLKKVYLGEMTLGAVTSTQDSSGEVLRQTAAAEIAAVAEADVIKAVKAFVGEIEQVPPMVSAVKINGRKLYELAREGKTVERKARKVTIYNIEITEMDLPKVKLAVTCSGGTYIRTLINDIGEKLDVGAYMSSLERQAVGSFDLAHSLPLEQVKSMLEAEDYSCLLPLEYGLEHLPVWELTAAADYENVLHGRPVKLTSEPSAGTYKIFYENRLIAVAQAEANGSLLKMNKVLISESDN